MQIVENEALRQFLFRGYIFTGWRALWRYEVLFAYYTCEFENVVLMQDAIDVNCLKYVVN